MKWSKKISKSASGLIFISFMLFQSCVSNYYPKISEWIYIENKTDSVIYINYSSIDSIRYFSNQNSHSLDTTFNVFSCQFNDALIPNLWMSENKFNELVSQLQIYKIVNNDTIYVDPKYYNKKTAWKHHISKLISGSIMFKSNDIFMISDNMISIQDSMFVY